MGSNPNGREEYNAEARSPASWQKLPERVCWKHYMRLLLENCSRTLLICIFLNLVNVTSHHFVITTGISTSLGGGVDGLGKKNKVFSHCLELENLQ